MRSLPHLGAAVLLAAPAGAWALGLGDIELQSALNQPFEAEIPLLSATAEELESLKVALASPETFDRYGLDRSADLSALRFEIATDARGRNVVRIRSVQRIDEPFLTMLVEARWPRGRLLREYTVLLDPPVLLPGPAEQPPIRQAQTESAPSTSASGAIARAPAPQSAASQAPQSAASQAQSGQSPVPRPVPSSAAAAPRPAAPSASARTAAAQPGGTYGPVQRNETLWGIASALKPADVTTNQMMVALYDANPEAFDSNMNLLRRGATLRIPERDALLASDYAAATEVVREQDAAWRSRSESQPRLRLVPPEEGLVSTGTGADTGANAAEGAAAGAAGDAANSAELASLREQVDSLRGQLDESQRLLELRDQELEALQAQVEQARAPDTEQAAPSPADAAAAPGAAPGVELESEQLFADETDSEIDEASGAAAEAGTDAEPEPVAEPLQAAPAPAPAPAASTSVVKTPEPSLLSRVLGWIANPVLLIGLGIGAVLLTAVWYLRHRREEDEDVTGRWDALEAEIEEEVRAQTTRAKRPQLDSSMIVEEQTRRPQAPEIGDEDVFTEPAAGQGGEAADETLSSQTVINLDQADPVAEADFHMAYGLYDQAADLVSKALEAEPGRRDLMLKLLEVYFVWGNKEAFLDTARSLQAQIGDAADGDWDKVLIMGKQICPDEPLFAEAAAAGAVDVDLRGGGSTEVDFAFDDKDSSDVDLGLGGDDDGLDFDLAATGERFAAADDTEENERPEDVGRGAAREEPDLGDSLDIGAQTAAGLEAALFMEAEDDATREQSGATTETNAAGADLGDAERREAEDDEELLESLDSLEGLGGDDDFEGLEALESLENTDRATTPAVDIDSLAATQESPTVESQRDDDDDWASLLGEASVDDDSLATEEEEALAGESPAVEAAGSDSPTVETPTIETPTIETSGIGSGGFESPTVETDGPDAPTVETPTLETAYSADSPTVETPTLETAYTGTDGMSTIDRAGTGNGFAEHTEEIDLDDLGLSLGDLEDLPDDVGEAPQADDDDADTREQPALSADDELLSATGVTEVLREDDDLEQMETSVLSEQDATLMAPSVDEGTLAGTEVLEGRRETDESGDTSLVKSLDGLVEDDGVDLNLEDFSTALESGDTVEQPGASSVEADFFGGNGSTPLDLDVGHDVVGPDDPTGTEQVGPLDPQTMTEIGTKLDLARAYIDMGDPDGARSILEEVLDEGDSGQRNEAQGLIDALSA